MRVISGQYTGHATNAITVATGLAHIDVLIVKTSGQRAILWLNSHPQYQVRPFGTTSPAMAVPTGFTINVPEGSFVTPAGNSADSGGLDRFLNAGAVAHDWIAIQCDGLDSAVGSYVGDAVDPRAFTSIGWQPTFILTHRTADVVWWRSDAEAGDVTYPMDGSASSNNRIQQFLSTGFELGGAAAVNAAGGTHYYFVARDVASILNVVPYTGTGAALAVTGVGFAPQNILIKSNGNNQPVLKAKGQAANTAYASTGTGATTTSGITSLDADGFTLGTNAVFNTNTALHSALCLRDGSSLPAALVD